MAVVYCRLSRTRGADRTTIDELKLAEERSLPGFRGTKYGFMRTGDGQSRLSESGCKPILDAKVGPANLDFHVDRYYSPLAHLLSQLATTPTTSAQLWILSERYRTGKGTKCVE